MQKKNRVICFVALHLVLLFCFDLVPVRAADNFQVTIAEDGKLSSNGKLIFYETDVAPGFFNSYSIDFDNLFREDVKVYVEKITVDTSAPTTDHFRLSFNGGEQALTGGVQDFTPPQSASVLVVPKGSARQLHLDFELLKSAGNEYQGKEFIFKIVFRIEAKGLDDGSIDPSKPGGGSSPQTGDQSQPLLWMIILLISALCMALLIIKRRKEIINEEQN